MTAEGHKVASLHGAKDATERDSIIDAFRQGKDKVHKIPGLIVPYLTHLYAGPDHNQRHSPRYRHPPSQHGRQLRSTVDE